MAVIVIYADRTRPTTPYTLVSLDEALDKFFGEKSGPLFRSHDEEELITREEAKMMFDSDGQITCYDEDGDKLTISRDHAAR